MRCQGKPTAQCTSSQSAMRTKITRAGVFAPSSQRSTSCLPVSTRDASATVIEKVAELALKSRLKSHREVTVEVDCNSLGLLSGKVQSAKIIGRGWRSPLGLTAQLLKAEVGYVEVDYGAVVMQQRIKLNNIPLGSAQCVFDSIDFGAFLVHPLFTAAAARAVQGAAFLFDQQSVQVVAPSPQHPTGYVSFTGVWATTGKRYHLTMTPLQPGGATPTYTHMASTNTSTSTSTSIGTTVTPLPTRTAPKPGSSSASASIVTPSPGAATQPSTPSIPPPTQGAISNGARQQSTGPLPSVHVLAKVAQQASGPATAAQPPSSTSSHSPTASSTSHRVSQIPAGGPQRPAQGAGWVTRSNDRTAAASATTQTICSTSSSSSGDSAEGSDERLVSEGLTFFFNNLQIDLQGAEMSFSAMATTPLAGSSRSVQAQQAQGSMQPGLLDLRLRLRVRDFPPLNIKF